MLALLGLIFLFVAFKWEEWHRPDPPDPALLTGNFRPCNKGTWNVIVQSLGQDAGEAINKVQELRRQYPHFQFELIATTAADQISNGRYTIVMGHGLPKDLAQDLVSAAQMAHIGSAGAYMAQYQHNADCIHLPRK
ncbi:hypothetical protein D3C85_1427030 [compost metagenome]